MAKLDPRADPVSLPPSAKDAKSTKDAKDDFSVDRVVVPKTAKKASIAEAREEREPADDEPEMGPGAFPEKMGPGAFPEKMGPGAFPETKGPGAFERTDNTDRSDDTETLESSVVPVGDSDKREEKAEKADKPARKVTSQDPRYEPIEKLLDLNDWKKIGDELGSMGDVGKLPPNLGLVAALAHNENAKDGDPDAVVTAIRCMAGLLGVSEDSPMARVLARRMLRKNPIKLRDRKAPPARTSMLIVLLTLVLGGGVGWLASIGSWRGVAHALHLM